MAGAIPPLNPLHVFEAASRLGTFTRAAQELGVTQSAVNRQIAVLEGYFGRPLFRRLPQGLALTPDGEAYRAEIAPAFARIAAATARLRQGERAQKLRLRVYATFAVKWLLPRLPRFQAAHPGIDLQLSTAVAPVDFARDDVDLAIQFGSGAWPGLASRPLLPDLIQPVCSPLLPAPPREPAELAQHRLLHSHYRRDDWPDWLASIGRPDLLQPGMEFPSSVLTLQAAAEGLGIAIGQTTLLGEDIRQRRLVPLFGHPLRRPLGHHLVWPHTRPPGAKGRALLAWLRQETSA